MAHVKLVDRKKIRQKKSRQEDIVIAFDPAAIAKKKVVEAYTQL